MRGNGSGRSRTRSRGTCGRAKGITTFTLFPWAGFLTAGAAAGVLLPATRDAREEWRAIGWLGLAGVALTLGGLRGLAAALAVRADIVLDDLAGVFRTPGGHPAAVTGRSYLWDQRPTARRWSPILQFGRTSLFVYWIHVEMVYGLIALPSSTASP